MPDADGSAEALGAIAREIYLLPPGQFTAERNRRVSAERSAGRRELAAGIAALRRPVISAWAINLLANGHRHLIEQLVELGRQLRELPEHPTGDQLRAFGEQRAAMVRALVAAAESDALAAGVRLARSAVIEVEQTLRAGLVDPGAAEAVLSGTMTSPLQYTGLGFTGQTTAARSSSAAFEVHGPREARPRPTAAGPTGLASEVPAARVVRDPSPQVAAQRRKLRTAAHQAVAAARRAEAAAGEASESAAGVLAAAQLRAAIAQRELQAAEESEREAEQAADAAADELARAERACAAAEQALAQLEQ